MKFFNLSPAVAIFIALSSAPAWATEPTYTIIGCPAGTIPASIELAAIATAQPECPLLEKKELKKLVDEFGAGTIFAYPLIRDPYTCVSGMITGGTIKVRDKKTWKTWQISSDSFSESAQRLFPVPLGQGLPPDDFNLFATSADKTLTAGAAMTALHLETDGDGPILDLLLNDHFLVTSSGSDTEDFLVVGSKGDYKVSGRLTGRGLPIGFEPLIIDFTINGTVCLREGGDDDDDD